MIHLVRAAESELQSGLRVEAQFKPAGEANGRIDDIVAFVPAADPAPSVGAGDPFDAPAEPEIQTQDSYCDLVYIDNASPSTRLWQESLLAGKLIGQVCPVCDRNYVGPRGLCCVDAVELDDSTLVEVLGKGVVANFTVITPTPYPGQLETEPFVRCSILLDGTDAVMGQQTDHRRARRRGPGRHARRDRVGSRRRARRRRHRQPRLRRHRWRRPRLASHRRAGRRRPRTTSNG